MVTVTLPVAAPLGTVVAMLVALQVVTGAAVPLKLTVPWAAPKFVPVIVTGVPTGPEVTERLVMLGTKGGALVGFAFPTTPQPTMSSAARHKTPADNGIRFKTCLAFNR